MTRIAELLAKGRTYSFEFFPPKNDAEQARLVSTLRELEPLKPSFVSVTYRGGSESRQRTFDLVTGMLRTTRLVPMAHLICVAHTRLELADILVAYRKSGVENLMALGGDPPDDPDDSVGELVHASELVELARAIGGFSVGWQPNRPDTRVPPIWPPTETSSQPSSSWPISESPSSSSKWPSMPTWWPPFANGACASRSYPASCRSTASRRSRRWRPWGLRYRRG